VVRALMEALPRVQMVYLGDTARAPYGGKSPETIKAYALQNAAFLVGKGVRALVIACNTVSSCAAGDLASRFDLPVFEAVSPGAGQALEVSRKLRIGVMGTRATVESGIYPRKIQALNPEAKVFCAACPLLVPLVEEGWLNRPETNRIVKKYLHPLKVRQIDTLILGCNHYPVLKKTIQRKIGMRVKLVDSARALAVRLKALVAGNPEYITDAEYSGNRETCRIYLTDTAARFRKTAGLIMGKDISVRRADI